jgi:dihydrofolate synthase/folylpolyglutamate synthase
VARVAHLVDGWYLCDLPLSRAATALDLAEVVAQAGAGRASVSTHARPADALAAAVADSDPADRIVVFGSFYTVGGVLEQGLPRLSAPHQA